MTKKCIALLPVMCSQARLLTYAHKCCTAEHFVSEALLCWVLSLQHQAAHSLCQSTSSPPRAGCVAIPQTQPRTWPEPSTAALGAAHRAGAARLALGYTDRRRQQEHQHPRDCRDGVPDQGTHQLCPAARWNSNRLCLH